MQEPNTITQQENPESTKEVSKEIPTSQLNLALMDIEDVMERAMCPYILILDTGKAVHDHTDLYGDGIDVAIKRTDKTKYAESVFHDYTNELKHDTTDKLITYIWNDVPIRIHVIDEDYPFFKNPQDGFYNFGDYKLPNPWREYIAWKDLIK